MPVSSYEFHDTWSSESNTLSTGENEILKEDLLNVLKFREYRRSESNTIPRAKN